jgi:mycothiol synthase
MVDGGFDFMKRPAILSARYLPDIPGTSIGAFTEDGCLAACASVHWVNDEEPCCVKIVGQVRPGWRSKGLGAYLMSWSGAQAQSLCNVNSEGPCELELRTESLTEAARHLYITNGFSPTMEELVMHRKLDRSLPDLTVPHGVRISSWRPDLSNQFFEAYEGSFRERPGFPGWSAAQWIRWSVEDDDFRPEWSLLASVGEVPVGFITADGVNPGGYVAQVGVIAGQRRYGLGSALLVAAMHRMRDDGETDVQLGVNVNNPGAFKTYQKLGFKALGRRARYQKIIEPFREKALPKLGYLQLPNIPCQDSFGGG